MSARGWRFRPSRKNARSTIWSWTSDRRYSQQDVEGANIKSEWSAYGRTPYVAVSNRTWSHIGIAESPMNEMNTNDMHRYVIGTQMMLYFTICTFRHSAFGVYCSHETFLRQRQPTSAACVSTLKLISLFTHQQGQHLSLLLSASNSFSTSHNGRQITQAIGHLADECGTSADRSRGRHQSHSISPVWRIYRGLPVRRFDHIMEEQREGAVLA